MGIVTRAQHDSSIDTSKIVFKAKLLTLNTIGVTTPDSLLANLERQEVTILESKGFEDIIFMKLEFCNKYYKNPYNENNYTTYFFQGFCHYYLAFDLANFKYYKLGGFNVNEVDQFIEEVYQNRYVNPLDIYIEEIDFWCLLDYTKKRKMKKKQPCFPVCSEKIKTTIVIH